jgi:hypothetical protein
LAVVFVKNQCPSEFQDLLNYFSTGKPVNLVWAGGLSP